MGSSIRKGATKGKITSSVHPSWSPLLRLSRRLPEMDGFEATKRIREKEKASGAHLPIIALTAHAMKGDEERCLAGGMDGYVTKPIKLEELFSVIEKLVPGMNRRSDAKVPVGTS